ncbi:hypothetical protein B0F90DRAFT_1810385 [Multifurca ochricompacta]|uniref:GST N-terminal domain-containing protein n=1 Tax=Multifurca ochricompacta TaxID=376703 RepID=A0AAD4M3D2_9AGAM|nr:hypothetical protein B0F90DRAFT_1810385 [Multifurca ochricompacta]
MAPPNIILYDVPSATPEAWAPNIWRIRFVLNYKRLPYRTVWIEYSDVERTLRSIGAPPASIGRDDRPVYALPAILIPQRPPESPIVLTTASVIVEYLEMAFPARPVFPEGSTALQVVFVHYLNDVVVKPLLSIMVPLSHIRLPEHVQAHIRGPAMAGPQRERAWLAVKEKFDFLAALLDKNNGVDGDGLVVMGRELSYADFVICSVLLWVERVSPHDGWTRMRQWSNGRWVRLWDRCKDYMDVL